MPTLILNNVEQHIIDALEARAAAHGTTMEIEHRQILNEALLKLRKKSFAEAIKGIPAVGIDSDFSRIQD